MFPRCCAVGDVLCHAGLLLSSLSCTYFLPRPLSARFALEMSVACLLLFLLHLGLTLAQRLASIYNFSKVSSSTLCGLPFKSENNSLRFPKSVSENLKNSSVNFDGRCFRKSQSSVVKWVKSARRLLELINMNDSSFDCPKWNMVHRKPNETELRTFWSGRTFEVVHNKKCQDINC